MSDAKPYDDLTEPDELDAVMEPGAGPAVLDFWSTTCGPCRMMAPDYERVAHEFADEPVKFYKIQTDRAPHLAAAFQIRSVPTLIFVNDGEVLDAVVGRMDAPRMVKKVEWLLNKSSGRGLLRRLFGGG